MGFDLEYIKELSVTVAGSLIGVFGALYIFKATNKKDHKKHIEDEKKLSDQKLAFFYFVVRKIWQMAQRHSETFYEFAEKIKKDPVKQHLIKSMAIYEFAKFTTTNWEDQFTSYVARIEKENRVQGVFEIINITEYFCFQIEGALQVHREILTQLNARKIQFKQHFMDIVELFNRPEIVIALSPDKLQVGRRGLNNYADWRGKTEDVELAQKEVILPLFNAFNTHGEFQNNTDQYNIRSKVLKCNSIYNDIVAQAKVSYGIFNEFSVSLNDTCKRMPNLLKDLEDYLRSSGFPDLTLLEEKKAAEC